MLNNPSVKSRVLVGVLFAALTVVSGLASCGGGSPPQKADPGSTIAPIQPVISPPVTPPTSSIAAVQAAWLAEPVRGTEYYYCDCGTGASGSCKPGNDANAGTSKSAPRRTIANAVTLNSSLSGTNTISFCKGGAWNVPGSQWFGNIACTAGTTCRDLRDYEPTTFTASAAPIVNAAGDGNPTLNLTGGGGVRIFNLHFVGDATYRDNAMKMYNGSHDVHIGNNLIEHFNIAVYNEISGPTATNNIKVTGNTILNSSVIGYLGAGDNSDINYNYFSGNGSSTNRDHTIYLSADSHVAHSMNVVGNYIYGQYGATCKGALIVGHGAFDGLNVLSNHTEVSTSAVTDGCWGISFGNGGYPNSNYLRNTVIGGNTVINGGNAALTWSFAPNIVVENNLIIQDWLYGSGWAVLGINAPVDAARTTPADDLNTGNIVRNNTVWFGPNATGGSLGGIRVAGEGSNHVLANNTVVYSPTTAGQGVICFDLPLATSAYSVVTNEHCYSGVSSFTWEKTHGATLAAWQAYSSMDANSIAGLAASFVNATSASGYNFKPDTGSPLKGTGSNAYKSTLDLLGVTRPNPPAIGAYEP